MNYRIILDEEVVGDNLSSGELNQYLLDLYKELSVCHAQVFTNDLRLFSENSDDFEDLLYDVGLSVPVIAIFGSKVLRVEESDF